MLGRVHLQPTALPFFFFFESAIYPNIVFQKRVTGFVPQNLIANHFGQQGAVGTVAVYTAVA